MISASERLCQLPLDVRLRGPIAPMRRTHIDICLDVRLNPAAKDATARTGNCTHAVWINDRQFEVAVKRCSRNRMPQAEGPWLAPAPHPMAESGLRRVFDEIKIEQSKHAEPRKRPGRDIQPTPLWAISGVKRILVKIGYEIFHWRSGYEVEWVVGIGE